MDLDRAHVDWTLGRYPCEDLPELAAQMLMQGHEGPAILELASYHRPGPREVPADLVDRAFQEAGRPPLSPNETVLLQAEEAVVECLQGHLSTVELGYRLWSLTGSMEDRWGSALNEALGWHLQWEDAATPTFRRKAELELLKAAGTFLKSRRVTSERAGNRRSPA